MGNFLKGAIFGTLAGVCIGAIVVAKNKKLSNKLKEGIVTAEGKIIEIKNSIEDTFSNDDAKNSESGDNTKYCDCQEDRQCDNNFSKKNKNC